MMAHSSPAAAGFVVPAILAIVWLAADTVQAHVKLTFPPVRRPNGIALPRVFASDMYSNIALSPIAQGPCGVSRGLHNPTSLLAGVMYNITWENNNFHAGGHRIELLSNNYSLIHTLFPMENDTMMWIKATNMNTTSSSSGSTSPNNVTHVINSLFDNDPTKCGWGSLEDPTLTSAIVVLPSDTCTGCVIRLIKHVAEVPNPAESGTVVVSCADVNIRKRVTRREYCSLHGTYSSDEQKCRCDPFYSGPTCQFQDECTTTLDCNFNGFCTTTESMAFPRRQCYCAQGFFGNNCEYRSAINITNLNTDDYNSEQLDDDVMLAWRFLNDSETGDGDEVEFIVQASNLTSWMAIGLRDINATLDCRGFPQLPLPEDNIPQSNMALLYTPAGIADAAKNLTYQPASPNLHPMECLDVIWVAVNGQMSRIRDMYTPMAAKPHDDEFYGGRQTLTAATAFDDGNITTLIFRRRLESDHPTDAQINPGEAMHVAFARGQDPNNPIHLPPRGIELSANNANLSNPNFYPRNELKYHGTDPSLRGFKSVVLVE